MEQAAAIKKDIFQQLQKQVLELQGHSARAYARTVSGLGSMEAAFPDKVFPVSAVHEFISHTHEDATATNGFMAAIAGKLLQETGVSVWISTRGNIFPPALTAFGIDPERVIFVELRSDKQALWAMEEALKCTALSAVICELRELTFTQSRRLQLAVEQSHVTGFIHRYKPRSENTVACTTRWYIRPSPTAVDDDITGVGFPCWHVELQKVKNGKPGQWQLQWSADGFRDLAQAAGEVITLPIRKTG